MSNSPLFLKLPKVELFHSKGHICPFEKHCHFTFLENVYSFLTRFPPLLLSDIFTFYYIF